jgi:sulfur-oxidizing protein SoxY
MEENRVIDQKRRLVLKSALGFGAAGLAVAAGAVPFSVFAASTAAGWSEKAFGTKGVDATIKALYGNMKAVESDQITVTAPEIAQNGAVVPVTVESALPNVTAMALLVEKNPNPLAAAYNIPAGAMPFVSNRLKMAETTDVIALVVSDGKLYRASKNVKVTVGGCGG